MTRWQEQDKEERQWWQLLCSLPAGIKTPTREKRREEPGVIEVQEKIMGGKRTKKMQWTKKQESVWGREQKKISNSVRACMCEVKQDCIPVWQVCVGVTAGNQAGMDLVSWGCGGSDQQWIQPQKHKKCKAPCLTLTGSQAQSTAFLLPCCQMQQSNSDNHF